MTVAGKAALQGELRKVRAGVQALERPRESQTQMVLVQRNAFDLAKRLREIDKGLWRLAGVRGARRGRRFSGLG